MCRLHLHAARRQERAWPGETRLYVPSSLLDLLSLPRAGNPRQRPKSPRQSLRREPAKWLSAKKLSAKNSLSRATWQALGKDFTEGQKRPRQSPQRRRGTSKLTSFLPRARLAGSRQRIFIFFKKSLCREPARLALGKGGLCREPPMQTLGKDFFFKKKIFAESLAKRLSAK